MPISRWQSNPQVTSFYPMKSAVAYPRVDPVIAADTDGSDYIPSDAGLQVKEAGLGVATANLPTPPIPSGVHFQAIIEGVHPRMRVLSETRTVVAAHTYQASPSAALADMMNWEELGTALDWLWHSRRKH